MTNDSTIEAALKTFALAVTEKMSQLIPGEPEDQLRGPFEILMREAAGVLGWKVVCTGETPLPGRLGRPDFAVHRNQLLAGYVELKAPGTGANPKRFSGHNREQWKRFRAIPNLLYTDGNEWALYRSGELIDKSVRLSGEVASEGEKAIGDRDAYAIERLLRDFLLWQPFLPIDRKGKLDLKSFAAMLAPLCRLLRQDVTDALQDSLSPLVQLAGDWRQLLFPDAGDEQFADAYAQTVAFALLLGRSEGANPLTLESAEAALAAQHSLLSRALQVLTDEKAREEMSASLDLLLRVIAAVPPGSFAATEDPWLYFYEDFLAAYDPKLRKDAGVYYTPVEVVRTQVPDRRPASQPPRQAVGFRRSRRHHTRSGSGHGHLSIGCDRTRTRQDRGRTGSRSRPWPGDNAGCQPPRLRADGRSLRSYRATRQSSIARPRRVAPT